MDELVQATRPCHGGIQDIRAIRRADHKHVLLTHGVDLREDLVHDAVSRLRAA